MAGVNQPAGGRAMPVVRSALGLTHAGEPLSDNRAPPDDIAPWVARIHATQVEMEPGGELSCGVFTDVPVLRIVLAGQWTVETKNGEEHHGTSALLFGAHTKRMPVRVKGDFATVGVSLRPGALSALKGPKTADTLDQIIPYDAIYDHDDWGTNDSLIEWLDPEGPPERWLKVVTRLVRELIERTGRRRPDPVVEAFDRAVLANPTFAIADFAKEQGIERRRLERLIKASYGQTARQVLRRARILDIAAHLRGVTDGNEAEEAALRFFDQSHMIREFQTFIGMTPRQFTATPQPFMTLTLEAREMRRRDELGRSIPGQPPPWRAGKEGTE